MKRFWLSLLFSSCIAIASAATFSGGGGQGTSYIGPTGDYPSLAAAAIDFSNYPGGCTGDWNLIINTPSLIEPNNVAFGNATNGRKVTIMPATGLDCTIQFTTTTVNPGATGAAWSGNLIIGTPYIGAPLDALTTTSNFTIDGSNNYTSSRNLTIVNTGITSETQLIRVVGGCQNTTIKNCVLQNNSSGNVLTFTVEFTARKATGGLDYIPNGCHISNCDITQLTGGNSQVILFRQASITGGITLGSAIDNVTVTSNTINGILAGVNLGLVANATVDDNILSFTLAGSGGYGGIQHNTSNGAGGYTVNIRRNKFVNWSTSSTAGMHPQIEVNSGITPPLTATYNINNNFLAGFQYTGTSNITSGGGYRAINVKCGVTSMTGDVRIYHNSFNMPNLPRITTANACASYYAVSINSTATNFGFYGTCDVKDNIFVMEQNNAVMFFRTSTLAGPGVFTSDYNTFWLGSSGAKMACYVNTGANQTANRATLADWQAQGFDLHSVSADPRASVIPGLGKWVSSTDLHFDAPAPQSFRGINVGIAVDIDGYPRSIPVIGADEVSLADATAARDWTLFE